MLCQEVVRSPGENTRWWDLATVVLPGQQRLTTRLRGAIPIDVQVERRAVEAEAVRHLRGVGGALRHRGHHYAQGCRGHLPRAAAVPTPSAGGRKTGAGPLADEFRLKLGQRRK